ncbi:STAS domain-containing protein [Pseudonocardia xishanensis]|uniref:STAS domain-containing protein n=1 Tax=Pseudonocardia xishanensis TaxID=630995 RepID=A0ABP8S1C4_9PSEU
MTAGVLNLTWARPEPGAAAVAVRGDLAHGTADRLLADVTELAGEAGLTRIVVDCGELAFCDSHGLAVLLMIQRRLSAAGIALDLDNRTVRLDRLFALTGTAALLTGSVPKARSQS